jgi:HEAT repeat protein
LSFNRPEVFITAAWSLRVLAVRETLPKMLRFVETKVQPPGPEASPPRVDVALDACLSQLFQAFGAMRYAEVEPVLIPFVPRRSDEAEEARVSAIWALGHLHANQPTPELVQLFAGRVADEAQLPRPESINVRAMAAVSLGRMNARSVLETMQQHYDRFPPGSPIREGLIWSIERMTGADLPPTPLKQIVPVTGFLQPTDPATPPTAE